MLEFAAWPKTPRLFRDMIVTEKIDGTNAAVHVKRFDESTTSMDNASLVKVGDDFYLVGAQSRKRLITPEQDNYAFARWVWENAETLARVLGEGIHYGEWWGSGIQRGYGLPKGEKRFSLFNVNRYGGLDAGVPGLHVVPVLYEGPFDGCQVKAVLAELEIGGSVAAPGFDRPEGVIVYHHALNGVFKATIEGDESPKGFCS